MKNLSTRNELSSVANIEDITDYSFCLEIKDKKLIITGLSDELKKNKYVPVMFRRIKSHSNGGKYRKKGWVSPYYSRVSIIDNTIFYSRDVSEDSGITLSDNPSNWLYITSKNHISWGSRGIKITKNSVGRSANMTMGIAFCKKSSKNFGYQLKDSVTPVIEFKLRYNPNGTHTFALVK